MLDIDFLPPSATMSATWSYRSFSDLFNMYMYLEQWLAMNRLNKYLLNEWMIQNMFVFFTLPMCIIFCDTCRNFYLVTGFFKVVAKASHKPQMFSFSILLRC